MQKSCQLRLVQLSLSFFKNKNHSQDIGDHPFNLKGGAIFFSLRGTAEMFWYFLTPVMGLL